MSSTLLLLVALALGPQTPRAPAPPRDAAQEDRQGTAVVRGRVTDAETGAPLARVVLTLSLQGTRTVRDTTSDASGAFAFTRLPAGEYVLSADPTRRTTHRPGTYGAVPGKPFGRHSIVTLQEGQVFEQAHVALQRSYVISGRVVDDDGEPVADVRVEAESVDVRSAGFTRSRSTDDRGAFRLWGYVPGTYRVCAVPLSDGPDQRAREGLIKTCYPSGSEAESQPVVVTSADPPELEIRLRRSRLFTVSGMVIDAAGAPAANAHIAFVTADRGGSSSRGMQNAGGTFTVRGVAPGDYFIRAESGSPTDGGDKLRQMGYAAVSVQGGNVENVIVAMEPAATVSGRIVFEGGKPAGLRTLTVRADGPRDLVVMRPGASPSPAPVKPDLTFELRGLFGPNVLLVDGAPAWVIKSMRYRGEERAHIPTDFKTAANADVVEIVLTNRTARLVARVLDERGQPTEDARVIVFPADPRQWGSPNIARFGAQKDGTFTVGHLRAGEYYVSVLTEGSAPRDRRGFEELSKMSESVTLLENDQRSIDLPLRK